MNRTFLYSALTLLAFHTGLACSADVYTWTDKNGAKHFSDSPPPDESIQAEQIELQEAPAIEDNLPADYFSVIRQAERMESRRLEYERIRTGRIKAETEARAQAEAEVAREEKYRQDFEVDDQRYTPLYPYTFFPGTGNSPHHKNPRPGHSQTEVPGTPVPRELPVQRESHIRVR